MKKLIVLLLFFMSVQAFATDLFGVWRLESFTWEDEIVLIGEIEFHETIYTSHNPNNTESVEGVWHIDNGYLFLSGCGFILEGIDENHVKLIPAFGDPEAKYYILSKGEGG